MVRSLLLALLALLPVSARELWLTTTIPDSPPVNQLRTDGNACGPACVLDAFRSGSAKWRQSISRIEGTSDTARIKNIIAKFGRRGSRLDPRKYRWNGRFGINATDLADMANELRTERWMGTVKPEVLFSKERESQTDLLKRTHKRLSTSLKKGLPPILGIRRVVWRAPTGTDTKAWLTVKRHFVVLTGMPQKLPRGATSFQITYHDPWGGAKYNGTIHITNDRTTGLPTLVASFPQSNIGKALVQKGEPTSLSLSSAIGVF